MRISAMNWVALTTLVLVVLTIGVSMNLAFSWVFFLTLFGQILLVIMVYKVLTDDYKTSKTFEDGYGDHSIKNED